jgi:hypothetical protein
MITAPGPTPHPLISKNKESRCQLCVHLDIQDGKRSTPRDSAVLSSKKATLARFELTLPKEQDF